MQSRNLVSAFLLIGLLAFSPWTSHGAEAQAAAPVEVGQTYRILVGGGALSFRILEIGEGGLVRVQAVEDASFVGVGEGSVWWLNLNQALLVEAMPTETSQHRELASVLEATHARVLELATVPEAAERAGATLRAGQAALDRDDVAAARRALVELESLEATLEQRYRLLIVAGPNSVSGVWRVPDVNASARHHYLIVEALDDADRPVLVDVRNEETGAVERVSTWGLRVPREVFERVRADKLADGIIQDRFVGEKARGALAPEFAIETTGGAITRW